MTHSHFCDKCGHPLARILGLIVDVDRRTVSFGGMIARLSPSEIAILKYLEWRLGKPSGRYEIFDHLYQLKPECDHPEYKIIDVLMSKLRARITPLGLAIITHHGLGYELAVPGTVTQPRMTGQAAHRGHTRAVEIPRLSAVPQALPADGATSVIAVDRDAARIARILGSSITVPSARDKRSHAAPAYVDMAG